MRFQRVGDGFDDSVGDRGVLFHPTGCGQNLIECSHVEGSIQRDVNCLAVTATEAVEDGTLYLREFSSLDHSPRGALCPIGANGFSDVGFRDRTARTRSLHHCQFDAFLSCSPPSTGGRGRIDCSGPSTLQKTVQWTTLFSIR